MNLNVDGNLIEIKKDNIKLYEVAKLVEENYKGYITMAFINGVLYDLNHTVYRDCDIEFLDTTTQDGRRLYFRVLSFLLVLSCKEEFQNSRVFVEHSISDGLYCKLNLKREVKEEDKQMLFKNLLDRMKKYIEEDLVINCLYMSNEEAMNKFKKLKRFEKVELLKYRTEDVTRIYECNGYSDYFYGYMFPSFGYLKSFDVKMYKDGVILFGPKNGIKNTVSKFKDTPKLSAIYDEAESWSKMLGVNNAVDLNKIIYKNKQGELIRTVEALHEKKIAQIADMITKENDRVILIAAPSSSGKTSFAHRLSIQLRVNGLSPLPISIDNYFVDRQFNPLDKNGNYDFESIDAIDIKKFNKDINGLLNGETIKKRVFDFKIGKGSDTDEDLCLKKGQPIILEGIHGLNPKLTENIKEDEKFKIYISAITQINLDDHNRISTTDLRLIRRIVRDYKFRGYNAEETIKHWPSVRDGEIKNIYPYQEESDVMFNSACVYELSVLKSFATEVLKEVDEDSEYYYEANRLLKILQYFLKIDNVSDILSTSIVREFIGGSKIVD